MKLVADTTLGPYRIESHLGSGGMGDVYRAHDTRLHRPVAIKVLPESFAASPERVARFEREARLLATLSHQNIAGIYGLEETNGTRYLVLELVEGTTLKDHLRQGAAPIEETLRICRQIADAVAAAHERGIIHRDLKPANIMLTHDDTVKVLDFGIAKALDPDGPGTNASQAPTVSADHHTAAGTMVGTPTYMSPEQARGKPIDKRSDIWSFGCVLYECLTGQTTFGGETVTDTLAKILERDPDYSRVPAATPPAIQMLLRRCLQKDRKKRLHDIGDARAQIEEAIADPSGTTLGLSGVYAPADAPRTRTTLPWLCAAVFAIAATVSLWRLSIATNAPAPTASLTRLAFVAPDVDIEWDEVSWDLSPDGRRVVITGRPPSAEDADKPPSQLYVRRLDEFESTPISGTEWGRNPQFSPSGRWIAFFSREPSSGRLLLKRVALDGSPATTIRDVTKEDYTFFTWLSDDTLFVNRWARGQGSSATLSINRGVIEPVELRTEELGDLVSMRVTSMLPGGVAALGTVFRVMGSESRQDTILVSLEEWSCRRILENADNPRYTRTGHLVFGRDEALLAVPFDATAGAVAGGVIPLISGVEHFDVAESGVLLYYPTVGAVDQRQLMTADAQGNVRPLSPVRRPFRTGPVVSRDGRWLGLVTWQGGELPRIWVYELPTGLIRPLTAADEVCFDPAFSPDGGHVSYTRWDPVKPAIMAAPIEGTDEPQEVITWENISEWRIAGCWTNDGRALLVTRYKSSQADSDVLLIDVDGGQTTPLLASAAREFAPDLSPDGKWLLYRSDETGEQHAHVRSFDAESRTVGPSTQVAEEPDPLDAFWSPDGGTIYLIDRLKNLVAITVTTEQKLTLSKPETILDVAKLRAVNQQLESLPAGERFVFVQKGAQEQEAKHLNVVLNWFDELKRRVPVH